MSGKILVIGATGKVGSELIHLLLEHNQKVVAAVRNLKTAEAMDWKTVRIARFDYTKPETFSGIFDGVGKMFLVSPPFNDKAVEQEIPVIDQAKQAGVSHIVKMSAMGVENMDQAPMRIVEKYIEASGVSYTLIRPNWFMQNFSANLAEPIKRGGIFLPAGDAKTSFIDVRDIAAVVAAALTQDGHRNKAYTLTGSQALDHHEVAAIISKAIGKPVKYVPTSEDDMRTALKTQGWTSEAIEFMLMLYQVVRKGWTATITPTVKMILSRDPISFEQYARDYSNAWA